MEEFPERAELRRMQREQERERRRIRDRQRRQSMTQEQRERHLARRRRNYQLRRQRAANAHAHSPFIPLPQSHGLESSTGEASAGEASTSDEFHGCNSSTSLDYRVLSHGISLNQGQETLDLGNTFHDGSSVHLETFQGYKPANSSGRLRLNHIKRLARNLTRSMVDTAPTHQVAAELITKDDVSVGSSTSKSLRLSSVKRLARSKSINYAPREAVQKDHNISPSQGIQLLGTESFIASSQLSLRMENVAERVMVAVLGILMSNIRVMLCELEGESNFE